MKSLNTFLGKEAIAIVGMSCRFPNANSLDEFWDILKNGKDTIAEISKERWDAAKYYDPDPQADRKVQQRHASLLSDIHDFDPLFFNISPAEASEMSPSQKLMLELAWEAIENSTIPFRDVKGKNIGVYVGNIWTDFEHYRKAKNARPTLHSAVGMSSNVVANRVSFALGFTGPSLVIDTGCSASLVALHLACQSVLSNESEMAVVGGINHILDPDKYIELTQFGGLSVKGRCSTFDNDADGFVRGEGGGVLLLKRLSDAERDGNNILAVIRGTAVNNNGFNDTLPATSTEGQISLLDKVYTEAGIQPQDVHYIEAHGTGTKLGDPNEARAIGEYFGRNRTGNKLRIGSVKTNIGHTEATAGIAGLIKVVLAMQHKTLPGNLNFNTPNPNIPFESLKLEVQKELTAWPVNGNETFKAGVNSFGWGGTNAHAALEEYRAEKQETIATNRSTDIYTLAISAKSSQAVKDYARAYVALLEKSDEVTFRSICISAALRRETFDHRHLFSGTSREEVLEALKRFIEDDQEVTPCKPVANAKIVFVFPGQGAQWLGMGRELLVKEKVFRDAIEACDAAFRPFTDWSLIDQINATPENSRLNEINVIQPAICAMQIALAKLWMSWGIEPQAVVGHSMGEVAAAYISGALKLEDAARIICERSRLMKTVAGKGGAMAVTELSREDAEKVAANYSGKLSVAVNNSHKSTVLAGDKASIDEVLAQLESKGLFCRLVKVDVASHSPQMDPLKEPLRAELKTVAPRPTVIPFVSSVYNRVMSGTDMGADYWVDNLRGCVQFASVMETLLQNDHTIFIEANPHPVLVNAVTECAEHNKKKIITAASLQRDNPEQEAMLKNLNDLYSKGYSIDWVKFYNTTAVPSVNLPGYPFQRERYELEDLSKELETGKDIAAQYPLLGSKISLANMNNTYFWESSVSLGKFPYLREHLIQDQVKLPVSCYIEIVLEAVSQVFNDIPVQIEDLHFSKYVTLSENDRVAMQVKLVLENEQKGKVYIFKKEDQESGWVQLATGGIHVVKEHAPAPEIFSQMEYHAPAYTDGINYYTLLRSIGFNYGKHFQQITGLDKVGNRPFPNVLFSIKADQNVALTSGKYKIHPAMISAFLQPIYGQLTSILEEGSFLDVKFLKIDQVELQQAINYSRELRGFLVFHPLAKYGDDQNAWSFSADITVANYDNTPVMRITGLQGVAMRKAAKTGTQGAKSGFDFMENYATLSLEADKQNALEQMLTQHVSKIIKISSTRIKNTMTFKGMGVDSLMAVQLRNLLEKDLSVKLPVGMFWSHPSIHEYAIYLREVLAAQDHGLSEAGVRTQAKEHTSWYTIPKPNPNAAFRVFCFHDAGGSAALFNGWENMLDESVEVVLIEMPGRGRRMEEIPYVDFNTFMRDIMPSITVLLDKPYIFLGHSMGGMLAFEITRDLRRNNLALPKTLFISSTSGLDAYDKKQVDYTLSDEELVQMYPHLDITNIGDVEIQKLLINILRADLQFLYHYTFTQEAPLDIPIIAIHGSEDERVKRSQIEQWSRETSASFKLIPRSGGHRYIEHDAAFVTQLVQDVIYSFAAQPAKTLL
ncbi:MAG TPA: acyltransferase domain-containing protein [Ohtaekwangia sp.]|uniref:acyltransferase domain-containing protein n=1 Tax=Ohtaekwangia sp. TaxID=2066019 RepID=UPI002F9454BD